MFHVNWDALAQVLSSVNLVELIVFLALGCVIGVTVGALPGLSTPLALALALPIAYRLPIHEGLALLVGTYKGGTFGGGITAICFATPGEASSAAIVADGYALTKRNQSGKALKMALYASTVGETVSALALIFIAIPLGALAPLLGPAELTALFFLALTLIIVLSGSDPARGIVSAGAGFFLGTLGRDAYGGAIRLDFGIYALQSGVSLVALLLGMFSIPEMITQMHTLWAPRKDRSEALPQHLRPRIDQTLTARTFFSAWRGWGIGAVTGTLVGALPGPGATVAAFTAYGLARQCSKHADEYGKGSLEGIAAGESADSATCGATLIPLLTFGVPGSLVAGLFGAALMMKGIPPGPRVIVDFPETIYLLLLMFLIGTPVNFLVGRQLIPVYAHLLRMPALLLWPVVGTFVVAGAYAFEIREFDIVVLLFAGGLGYCFRILRIPLSPLVLAFLVGPLFEESLRRALTIGQGDIRYLFKSPFALALWSMCAIAVISFVAGRLRLRRRGMEDALDLE